MHSVAFIMRYVRSFPKCAPYIKPYPTKTFFDTSPFEKKGPFGTMRAVLSGESPHRPEKPRMEDVTWNLLQSCWERIPAGRPPMERIVAMLTPPHSGLSVAASAPDA